MPREVNTGGSGIRIYLLSYLTSQPLLNPVMFPSIHTKAVQPDQEILILTHVFEIPYIHFLNCKYIRLTFEEQNAGYE